MTTINETLDKIMELDFESREMLLEIAQKRQIEDGRKDFATNAKKSITDYKNGKLKAIPASQAVDYLNKLG